MMYAVIRTGSKQYRVSPGDVITVEKLDVDEGKKVIVNPKELAKVRVAARVVSQGRSKKLVVFKYKPKKGYQRKKGHRQQLTRLEIEDIIVSKSAPKKTAEKAETPAAEGA
jgi:large subunit ribosomal protein L21